MLVSIVTVKCRSFRRIGKSIFEAPYLGRRIHGCLYFHVILLCCWFWTRGALRWHLGRMPRKSTSSQGKMPEVAYAGLLHCIKAASFMDAWETGSLFLDWFALQSRSCTASVWTEELIKCCMWWTADGSKAVNSKDRMLLSSFCDVFPFRQEKQGQLFAHLHRICLFFCSCCDFPNKGKEKQGCGLGIFKSPGSNFYVKLFQLHEKETIGFVVLRWRTKITMNGKHKQAGNLSIPAGWECLHGLKASFACFD